MENEPQYINVIAIPRETRAPNTNSESAATININTATSEELLALHGIGEVIAGRIIEYRESVEGGFLKIEEIMEVQGIGETIFERIRDFIYVD
jgi:competence protein ComEA